MDDRPPFDDEKLKTAYGSPREIDEARAIKAYGQMRILGAIVVVGYAILVTIIIGGFEPNNTLVGLLWLTCIASTLFYAGAAASFGAAFKQPWLLWGLVSVITLPIGLILVFLFARHKLAKIGLLVPNQSLKADRPDGRRP
jgi:hypothetical protein